MKGLLRWVGRLAPYAAGVVFLVAAASKIWSFPDWLPYLASGEADIVSYLGVLAVLIEVPLGLFLIFSNSKGLLSAAAMLVLVVFTAYLGYVYGFTDGECGCGGGEQWVASSREGRLWFSLARNGLLLGGLGLHLRTTWITIAN